MIDCGLYNMQLRQNVTAHDAAYLALAEEPKALLLTRDAAPARASGTTHESSWFRSAAAGHSGPALPCV